MPFDGNVLGDDTETIARQARARPGYEGYALLGDVLGGGATQRAEAREPKYLGQAADAAYKFNRASQSRSEAIIKQSMLDHRNGGDAAIDGVYGADSPQANFAKFILGSAATPNAGSLGKFQAPGYVALEAERQDALAKGDFKRVNATTAVLGDKPYEPARVVDGNVLPDGVGLGDPDFQVTPLPQTAARIAQGQQRTDASVARSERAPAPHAAHTSATSEEATILDQARARIAKGADPVKVAGYLRDKGYPGVAKKIYGGP